MHFCRALVVGSDGRHAALRNNGRYGQDDEKLFVIGNKEFILLPKRRGLRLGARIGDNGTQAKCVVVVGEKAGTHKGRK